MTKQVVTILGLKKNVISVGQLDNTEYAAEFISGKTGRDEGTHDGPSWARRTVEGSRFKTLRNSEIGY